MRRTTVPAARSRTKEHHQSVSAEYEARIEALEAELQEARDREAAVAEVLQVINASPGDLTPVFDAILEKAHGLCDGAYGSLHIADTDAFRAAAVRGMPEEFVEIMRRPARLGPNHPAWRLAEGSPFVQILDSAEIDDERMQAAVHLASMRTVLFVPLRKDKTLVGYIVTSRPEIRPFTDKQITLLQNFAAQAVIAMENARLITETREALEQQTATAEVLSVINSSPGELTPVFDAILEKAHSLCGAAQGSLVLYDGQIFHGGATRGVSDAFTQIVLAPRNRHPDSPPGRLLAGERLVHVPDLRTMDAPVSRAAAELEGARTGLFIPLRRKDALLGYISALRQQVLPFSDSQIALLENFAAQAVIAMDNARLITETREALDQQTATAEVLGVINASPGDLTPVFDSVLEKALNLCGAAVGVLQINDGDRFRTAATRGVPAAYAAHRKDHAFVEGPGSLGGRIRAGESVVHVLDLKDDEPYRAGDANRVPLVDLGGARTGLAVPLSTERGILGFIIIYRQEVRPFSDKQIALLQNFAAQSVIAVENARLINETREALEQQTATAEVLGVINSSPGDLAPIFDAVLEKAMRLCEAAFGILWTYDGEHYRAVAFRNVPQLYAEFLREPPPVSTETPLGRIAAGEALAQISDMAAEEIFGLGSPLIKQSVQLGGFRTVLGVALRKEETLLGAFTIYRQEVRPFSDKQIALLENFAAQAVIAMENARLITETREALEQQTATAEVLQVINSSPGNLTPVFDAMLSSAARLCEADGSRLFLSEGEAVRAAAQYGEFATGIGDAGQVFVPHPDTALARALKTHKSASIEDAALYSRRAMSLDMSAVRRPSMIEGWRSLVVVPMLREANEPAGAISLYRRKLRPFGNNHIRLVENFAAQAVIAMENARLITETHEALEQQTATAEVLGVINSSPGDLAPVFDAMLEKAMRLCEAAFGIMNTYDGERFRTVKLRGAPHPLEQFLTQSDTPPPEPESPPGRIIHGEDVVLVDDLAAVEGGRGPRGRAMVELGGARSYVTVALRKDGNLLGSIAAYRDEVRPFTDKQIALLQNFAAQAVIAMENARLVTETGEALERQTATAEILQVINSSPTDLQPVFQAIADSAARLCNALNSSVYRFDGELIHFLAQSKFSPQAVEVTRQLFPAPPSRDNATARAVADRAAVHIPEVREDREYRSQQWAVAIGLRSVLSVPMLRDGRPIGAITVNRAEAGPFPLAQIELLKTFADQAVIAIENTRLITETREALEQQTATAEVLGVINSSPGDLAPVFEAILDKAHKLCGAAYGSLQLYDGERFRAVAVHGLSKALADRLRQGYIPGPNLPISRLLDGERFAHVADLGNINDPLAHSIVELGDTRTVLWVALRKDQKLLGVIAAARLEVRPFSEKEIALLDSFAAQAVIAMENARLLGEIRQRQQELRVTFDNMADGVVMFDENQRLAAWNRNFQELLDLPDTVLAERPSYGDYLRILAERGEFGTQDVEVEVSRRLENTDQEFRQERTRSDGQVIEVRRNAVPDGGFVLIYSDITERKRSEAEIRAARDTAEATLRDLKAAQANLIQAEKMASLGQLTAGIAHEIKNPLNFVNNFASLSVELLEELKEATEPALATLNEDKRAEVDETLDLLANNLEKIAEHGRRADGIVKSMLEHSRGVTGERREVDLNNLIDEALNLAYHGARAQDQNFNITLERDFDAAVMPIELAPQEITRVCLNLFSNGFYAATKRARGSDDAKFTPALNVATRDLGEAVEIRIRDNGVGIPAEVKDKLFQPFFTTKPTGEGTGLGLSISYDIVTQQHGGSIEVESEVGAFTEFTIRLPRQSSGTATPA